MESPRSPEAEIGHRVEDLWEVAEPQLSPSEKLNSCFEDIPVDSFPRTHPSQGLLARPSMDWTWSPGWMKIEGLCSELVPALHLV
ncbi:hypothetical protein PR202_ga20578 [Eleusine coracana subsp. coracana]|uniref:Uncharacterized protein n=1 Tax=Eleusine coracana subsp. coracana TaxID=191504 RepID=A0AAV5CYM6_ELECO|nr:hypothetical protein PR202_ga20578 [Eleusine coracana subsp. coracana]